MSVIKKIFNELFKRSGNIEVKIRSLRNAFIYHKKKIEINKLYKKVKNTPVEGMILADLYSTLDFATRTPLNKIVMEKLQYSRYHEES